MPRPIWSVRIVWALCCLGMFAGACTSAATVVAQPAETPEPVRPTALPSTESPEQEELTQDDPDDAGEGSRVAFPSSRNLLRNPRDSAAATVDHPLAVGLADTDRIGELLGGQWQLTSAESVESDQLPSAFPCSTDDSMVRFESGGINLRYQQDDGQTMTIVIRQGPDTSALFDTVIPSMECLAAEVTVVAMSPVGSEDQIVAATVETESTIYAVRHTPIVMAIRGDLSVGADSDFRTANGAQQHLPRLATLVSEILDNTPSG